MADERKEQLAKRFAEIGVDRMLADQGTGFVNTAGYAVDARIYAGEWVSAAKARKDNTSQLMQGGKRAFRRELMETIFELTDEGEKGKVVTVELVVEHLRVETEPVLQALDYLEGEGLLEHWGPMAYGVTHAGIVEMEALRDHPDRATAHFPPTQQINIYGGQNMLTQGSNFTANQINNTQLPVELQSLSDDLAKADGGQLSTESQAFLNLAAAGGTPLKVASAVEDVAAKGQAHKSIVDSFKEALTKKLAESAVEAATKGAEWLHSQGPALVTALNLYAHHR